MGTPAQKLAEAVRLHQHGDLTAAQRIYEDILATDPRHADALNLLGLIALQAQDPRRAATLIAKAAEISPSAAPFHNNLGLARMNEGSLEEAAACYQRALDLRPEYAEAYYNLGICLQALDRIDESVVACERAIQLQPDYARALHALGVAYGRQGELDRSIACLERAVDCDPKLIEAHDRLAVSLRDAGRLDAAATAASKAIELNPQEVTPLNTLGTIQHRQGEASQAVETLRQAVLLRPDFLEAHNNLCVALLDLQRTDEAAQASQQALRLDPHNAIALSNLSSVQRQQGKLDEALATGERALEFDPTLGAAHCNLGTSFHEQGRLDSAAERYRQAIELDADCAEARQNLGMVLLSQGQLAEGWKLYEWRWHSGTQKPRAFRQPSWNGQPCDGKTVLVHAEQGFGDTLQFARYLEWVKGLFGRVVFECQPALERVLQGLSGVDQLVAKGRELPAFDFQIPLMSVPRFASNSLDELPAVIPYLSAELSLVKHWSNRLRGHDETRIGIFWQGNPRFPRDRYRSVPARCFAPLATVPDVNLISFQRDHGVEQLEQLRRACEVTHIGDELNDFADTAAAMTQLDLFVTTDTAVAHLAGALGLPVWLVTSFAADWRWFLEREDSPWYPTMRLFRQTKLGRWDDVFERIRAELATFVERRAASRIRLDGPHEPRVKSPDQTPGLVRTRNPRSSRS